MFGIKSITRGEALYLLRKRKNLNQTEAAKIEGVNRADYGAWETGKQEYTGSRNILTVKDLVTHEFCVIARRREGIRQRDLSAAIKKSRYWVVLMEAGEKDCSPLVEHWSNLHGE